MDKPEQRAGDLSSIGLLPAKKRLRTFAAFHSWVVLVLGSLLVSPASTSAQGLIDEVGMRIGHMRTDLTVTYPGCGGADCISAAAANAPRSSVVGAAFARKRVWKPVSLQLEMQYATKGFAVTQPTIHADYLELPVLMRTDVGAARVPLSMHFVAGVAPGVRVQCRAFASLMDMNLWHGSRATFTSSQVALGLSWRPRGTASR